MSATPVVVVSGSHAVLGVSGRFTCGASTAPVGGMADSSDKAASLALPEAQP